jgi:hypothetical protein
VGLVFGGREMAFELIKAGQPRSKDGTTVCDPVRFVRYKQKDGKRPIQIRLSSEVMKSLRWVIGDRAEVLFDRLEKQILIRRVPVGGWALACGTGGKREACLGKPLTSCLRIGDREEVAVIFFTDGRDVVIPKHEITPTGLLLRF